MFLNEMCLVSKELHVMPTTKAAFTVRNKRLRCTGKKVTVVEHTCGICSGVGCTGES